MASRPEAATSGVTRRRGTGFAGGPIKTSLIAVLVKGVIALLITHNFVLSLLAAWTAGLVSFTYLEWLALVDCDAKKLHQRAASLDRTGARLVPLSICFACISLAACVIERPKLFGDNLGDHLLFFGHFAIIFASIGASWLFVQTAFAIRYAHIFFTEAGSVDDPKTDVAIAFPGGQAPDGHDMLHFSVVIGVAGATADISIQSKTIRRLSTMHSIYSYVFNACVLALCINLTAASL